MGNKKITKGLSEISKRIADYLGVNEKRAFSERRTGASHVPEELSCERRGGDDRRLSGPKTAYPFYYPL